MSANATANQTPTPTPAPAPATPAAAAKHPSTWSKFETGLKNFGHKIATAFKAGAKDVETEADKLLPSIEADLKNSLATLEKEFTNLKAPEEALIAAIKSGNSATIEAALKAFAIAGGHDFETAGVSLYDSLKATFIADFNALEHHTAAPVVVTGETTAPATTTIAATDAALHA